jgi:hypothetical protein
MDWNSLFVGKITGYFSLTVPPFPAEGLSHCWKCGGVWQCKCELSTISLNGCGTSGGISLRGPAKEEECSYLLLHV